MSLEMNRSGSSGRGESSVRNWFTQPRATYADWQEERPVLGAGLLILGGAMIGYVPVQFTSELMFIGGTYTVVGMLFAILVSFCGFAVLTKPHLSTLFGVLGMLLSTLSLFGALGGLFVGMVVGTLGGVLCFAWTPPEGYDHGGVVSRTAFIWQDGDGEARFSWERGGDDGSAFDWGGLDADSDAGSADDGSEVDTGQFEF